jgi:hypothetical protein
MDSIRVRLLGLGVGLLALQASGELMAQDSLPSEMRSALEKNVAALSPLEVTWERSRTSDLPTMEVLKRIKYQPMSVGEMQPYKVRFMCDAGKCYYHLWRSSVYLNFVAGQYVPDLKKPMNIVQEETSFDGAVCYIGNGLDLGTGSPPALTKQPLDKAVKDVPDRRLFTPDFLLWAGFRLPRSPAELARHELRALVLSDADQQGVISIAVGQEKTDGAMLKVVEIKTADRTVRFVLDPAKAYAVRRRTERTKAGQPITDAECSDFVKLDPRDVWLPRRVRVAWHTWETIPTTIEPKPILTEGFRLLEWKTDPIPAAQFVVNYGVPGAAIKDAVVAGAEKFKDGFVNYRLPANPQDLDQTIETAVRGAVAKKQSGWLFIANAAFLVVLATLIGVRWQLARRRRSNST